MQKSIIYITVDDKNWLKGLEYFVDEFELEYKVVQHRTVEDVLQLSNKSDANIYAIIMDWELSTEGLHQEEAITSLELSFPFIPIMGLSATNFKEHVYTSTLKNKFTTDPEQLFKDIQTFIFYYKHEWLRLPVNRIIYSVQIITSDINPLKNMEDVYFGHKHPLIGRNKAIDYFKKNPNSFNIILLAYNTKQPNYIPPDDFVGELVVNSGALLDREILSSLNAEYFLYKKNNFPVEGSVQTIQLPDSRSSFNVLSGIVDDAGKMLLR